MNYNNYNIEDFLSDRSFVEWVVSPSRGDLDRFWENVLSEHPHLTVSAAKAREIITSLELNISDQELEEDAAKVWGRLQTQIQSNQREPATLVSTNWMRYAAVIALAVCLSVAAYVGWNGAGTDVISDHITWIEKSNPAGRKSIITLVDGTKVHLNAESSLKYIDNFLGSTREVILSGEAFFDVARDETKPFIINTGDLSVQVLGTSFNVHSYPGDRAVKVAVSEGKVAVKSTATNEEVVLMEDEMATYSNDENSLVKSEIGDVGFEYGWKDKKLVLKNQKITEITKILSRWYGVDFDLGSTFGDLRVTATFTDATLREVMESLSHTYKFKYEIEGKTVNIRK